MNDMPSVARRPAGTAVPVPSREARAAVSQVLVVVVHTTAGTTRRRVFLSLKAAEKAVTRSHAKDQRAEIVLARLCPEPGIGLWEENGGEA